MKDFKVKNLKRVSGSYLETYAAFLKLDFVRTKEKLFLFKNGRVFFSSKYYKVVCEFLNDYYKKIEKQEQIKKEKLEKAEFALMEQKRKMALNEYRQLSLF